MKTCKTFEELQALGAEAIHEKTHISRDKIELVLAKSYGEVGKVQFMGFLSILEREYGINLDGIREEYKAYMCEYQSDLPPKPSVVLQASSNHRQKWIIAGSVLIVVLIVAGYFMQSNMANVPKEDVMQLSTAAVQVVDEPKELNTTQAVEANASVPAAPAKEQNVSEPQKLQTALPAEGVEIHPIYKVWAGMIDMESHKKTQMITKEPIKIDTSKNWLIMLGHGRIEIDSPSERKELQEKGAIWFVYENGELKRITKEEFAARNGGNDW